jgi:P27 family predicted phage terminase small subunit
MANIARISDSQKKIQGSSRWIKNTPPTKPIARLWATPADLGEKGKEFYRQVGARLVAAKVLTELDRYPFEELAALYEQLNELRAVLRRDGYVLEQVINNQGTTQTKRHPAQAMYKETLAGFIGLAQRFGLTPYDRRRLDLQIDENPNDKTREFLGL